MHQIWSRKSQSWRKTRPKWREKRPKKENRYRPVETSRHTRNPIRASDNRERSRHRRQTGKASDRNIGTRLAKRDRQIQGGAQRASRNRHTWFLSMERIPENDQHSGCEGP